MKKKSNQMNKLDYKKVEGYTILTWRMLSNWPGNFKCFYRTIRDKVQRANRGVATMDCWNFDHYFFTILYNGLVRFKEGNNGYPHNLTWDGWNEVIDEMVSLAKILAYWEDWTDEDADECINLKNEEEFEQYQSKVEKRYAYREKCKKRLFELLEEHIDSLWW